jgi:hypothetical protein
LQVARLLFNNSLVDRSLEFAPNERFLVMRVWRVVVADVMLIDRWSSHQLSLLVASSSSHEVLVASTVHVEGRHGGRILKETFI